MRDCFASEQRDCKYAGNCANKLSDDVKHGIPVLHLAQTPERESDRGIEMRAGPFSKRRENKSSRSAAHRDSCQRASCEFARDEIQNWRARMLKQNREQPGSDHEEAELGCLAEILRPMFA